MKTAPRLLIVFAVLFTLACDKEKDSSFGLNCNELKNGIIYANQEVVGVEISKLLKDLVPNPTGEDNIGHSSNFEILIDRLAPCNETSASVICYCCIYTNPPQTEVLLMTYRDNIQYVQVIDIITPRDSALSFRGMHDAK